jgi:hypothetical protein
VSYPEKPRQTSTCGHCRWWNRTNRTANVEWGEEECRKRAPFPANHRVFGTATREFPITKGLDTCGDFRAASAEVYREDYREELGPWISFAQLFGRKRP